MSVTAAAGDQHLAFAVPACRTELFAKLACRISSLRNLSNELEHREKGMRGPMHRIKSHIGVRTWTAAIDQPGLRCQFCFFNQSLRGKPGEQICPRTEGALFDPGTARIWYGRGGGHALPALEFCWGTIKTARPEDKVFDALRR
jgi:hypothetical protein